MMWLAAETTDNEEFKGREEAAEQEGEAEREPVEKRGKTTEQEDKEGSSTVTGREGATGRAAAEEGFCSLMMIKGSSSRSKSG